MSICQLFSNKIASFDIAILTNTVRHFSLLFLFVLFNILKDRDISKKRVYRIFVLLSLVDRSFATYPIKESIISILCNDVIKHPNEDLPEV